MSQPLRQRAYQALKHKILNGEMLADTFYLERDLESLLNISRTPIREALVWLQSEGLIQIQPRHGMRIRPVAVEDMEDIYQVITALECEAVRVLSQRGLSEVEVCSFNNTGEAMAVALEKKDRQAWARADEAFHRCLLDFCGNGRLKQTVLNYWDQMSRVRYMTLPFRDLPFSSTRDHQQVIDAIVQGKMERAVEVHRHHRAAGSQALLKILRRLNRKNLVNEEAVSE